MFIARLKDSIKKIAEPLLWLSGTLVLLFLLEKIEALRNIISWSFMPVLCLLLLLAVLMMVWAWIQWQFVEPYKSYKASKSK